MTINNFSDLFYLDGSVFVRTVFPIIGMLVFKDNLLLGIGGGNFRFELLDYLLEYFPKGLTFASVRYFTGNITGSTFNLFTRLLTETGIVGFILFIIFLISIYRVIVRSKSNYRDDIILFFSFLVCIYFQFDSFAFIHIWIGYAIINNLYELN